LHVKYIYAFTYVWGKVKNGKDGRRRSLPGIQGIMASKFMSN